MNGTQRCGALKSEKERKSPLQNLAEDWEATKRLSSLMLPAPADQNLVTQAEWPNLTNKFSGFARCFSPEHLRNSARPESKSAVVPLFGSTVFLRLTLSVPKSYPPFANRLLYPKNCNSSRELLTRPGTPSDKPRPGDCGGRDTFPTLPHWRRANEIRGAHCTPKHRLNRRKATSDRHLHPGKYHPRADWNPDESVSHAPLVTPPYETHYNKNRAELPGFNFPKNKNLICSPECFFCNCPDCPTPPPCLWPRTKSPHPQCRPAPR